MLNQRCFAPQREAGRDATFEDSLTYNNNLKYKNQNALRPCDQVSNKASVPVQLLKSKKRSFFRAQEAQRSNTQRSAITLANQLACLNIWNGKKTIASYRALKGEVSPCVFQQKCSQQISFVFPQFRNKKMFWAPFQGEWELGPYPNLWQPTGLKSVHVSKIDVFLVPGLAFDREGRRLGRGGGWYDRALSKSQGLKIGLAHVSQILNTPLPEESHDVRMDMVVTEKFSFIPIKQATTESKR